MADPVSETSLTKKIFDLYVARGLEVMEIARELDIPRQTISQTIESQQFTDMSIAYWEAFKEGLSPRQKILLMQAKHRMINAVPGIVRNVTSVAQNDTSSVGMKAAEMIFDRVGLPAGDQSPASGIALNIFLPPEAVAYAKKHGLDGVVEAAIVDNAPYSRQLGTELGEGIGELDNAECDSDT